MSRTTRRTLSCLFVLAIIVVAVIGWTYLPGSGGVVAELRWLLARDRIPPQHFNRATGLMLFAEERTPGARGELLQALLFDDDQRVVGGALALSMAFDILRGEPAQDVREAFRAWFQCASVEEKLSHLESTVLCSFGMVLNVYPDPWGEEVPEDLTLPLTQGDLRWMVAGTAVHADFSRGWASHLIFGGDQIGQVMSQRLDSLHTAVPKSVLVDDDRRPIDLEALTSRSRPSAAQLLAMRDDPAPGVRWGAGCILAVAGDQRGLPAFCDWLQHNPKRAKRAHELMTDLFGPDWRKPFESGSAASQPGAGDGGG